MQFHKYWFWENALPKWFCEEQIKNIDWSKQEKGKVYNYQQNPPKQGYDENLRIVDLVWESETSPIGCIAQAYANIANATAGWNYELIGSERIQIAKYSYKDKSFHDWHQDHGYFPDENGLLRKLSISILLSDENSFEGGLFEFKNFDKQPMLKQGSILVFPSQLEHRVSPMISGERYSAVTWINGPAYR
jgi:PKHD-type hydroxylase